MRFIKESLEAFFVLAVLLALLISFPLYASGQTFPDKPITIYCGYEAGATTDLTTRAGQRRRKGARCSGGRRE